MKRTLLVSTALLVALAGCGKSETPAPSGGDAKPSGTTGPGGTGPAVSPGTTAPAGGCTTSLKVVNAEAADDPSLKDRSLSIETAWADQGPHPDNTVDYDKTLEVALAEFEIPKDPQFGYSIPVGSPTVPDGKVYAAMYLSLPSGKIEAGKTFVGSTSSEKADGTINSYTVYSGSNRLLPGDATVTITKITDDIVCGKISSVTKTSLQSFVGVEGTFKVDRIQALEAAEEK